MDRIPRQRYAGDTPTPFAVYRPGNVLGMPTGDDGATMVASIMLGIAFLNGLAVMQERDKKLKAREDALVAAAESADGDEAVLAALSASADERQSIGAERDALAVQIAQEQRRRERLTAAPTVTEAEIDAEAETDADEQLPTPFRSLGDQLLTVARSTTTNRVDERLASIENGWRVAAAAQGLNESVPSDGGFLVQHDLGTELYRDLYDTGIVASRTRRRPVSGNGFKANAVDETSRADGSRMGGLQAYWLAEAGTKTASRPKFRQLDMDLQKLIGVYYATDELLQDAPALEAEVGSWFTEEFGFKLDDGVIRGDGVGKPLGILNSAATVAQAAEGGQTADTINSTNVVKMLSRLPASSVKNAVWLINQEAYPQLPLMTIGNWPVFLPATGLQDAPLGTLLGRPIVMAEQCSAIGDVGDIILADLSRYLLIEKNGIQTATSIHVQFLTDETAFRFVLRANGQPIPNAAITPYKGSATISPFVTLAAR